MGYCARCFGNIIDSKAYIVSINSPKSDSVNKPIRGFKTYEKVLKILLDNNIETVVISNQSKDSRYVLNKLVGENLLVNPRRLRGVSVDEHPTEFTINPDALNDSLKNIQPQEEITEVSSDEVNLSSFKPQPTLNNKIWKDNKLNPTVRTRLLKIADDFMEFSNIDKKVAEDVLFIGSLANYNWSSYSDFDLHILVDFKKINEDVELVKEYFDGKKKVWNDAHESLKIYGYPVEVYVQDVNEENASVGVFSLETNKWVKKPKYIDDEILDKKEIKKLASKLMTKIDNLYEKYNSKPDFSELEKISIQVKNLLDKIKRIRKESLKTSKGEMSIGNIVFKVLRRTEYLSKLMELKNLTYDKLNSIK